MTTNNRDEFPALYKRQESSTQANRLRREDGSVPGQTDREEKIDQHLLRCPAPSWTGMFLHYARNITS